MTSLTCLQMLQQARAAARICPIHFCQMLLCRFLNSTVYLRDHQTTSHNVGFSSALQSCPYSNNRSTLDRYPRHAAWFDKSCDRGKRQLCAGCFPHLPLLQMHPSYQSSIPRPANNEYPKRVPKASLICTPCMVGRSERGMALEWQLVCRCISGAYLRHHPRCRCVSILRTPSHLGIMSIRLVSRSLRDSRRQID